MTNPRRKPLYDWTEAELVERLRTMYESSIYQHAPNDIVRELERKAAVRQCRVAFVTSIVSAITAVAA